MSIKNSIVKNFSSAHFLIGHEKCGRIHGHNWKVQVHVVAERLNEIDIAVDFHDLKKWTKEILEQLDHGFLNEIFPFTEINPSSENIARWIFESLKKKINTDHVRLSAVTVWESDSASATYYED